MKEEKKDIEYKDQKIVDIKMEKEVKKSFLEYSMSVIVSRALPDVRDGLKPVHRRILYAMYEDHLTHDNPFRKSATTVGNVLGRYHPHGDSAVYDAMVRLAQPFSLRYPLVEGHGNFGNVDGDGAAAYRYTEARMAKLADEMLADIDKEVVDFDPNFDNMRKEPQVLPARFPNLLVNGSVGIAVGMATNVPPHNLSEVIDGTVYLIEHPEATVPELMQFIKGPDFPTYATIYGTNGIRLAYETGRGKISVRAKAKVFEDKRRIEIYEIPYQVNKSMLVASMAELVKAKRIEGITALRDESGRNGMKIVVEYRRDCNGQIILNQLYKYTQLQDTCAINMLALVDGEPKTLGLIPILQNYIKHREEIIRRRTVFELDKAKKRAHILEGLKIAIENIDEVIAIIRGSKSIPDAKDQLCNRFDLDDIQATAIVEMQLGKLSNLETFKIEEELRKLLALIEELEGILADESKILAIIKEDLLEIKKKYGDERRTVIMEAEDEIVLEDLIDRHTCVITISHAGYFKRSRLDLYEAHNRGGKGGVSAGTKDDDFIENIIITPSHSYLMLFTNKGRVYVKKAYEIPESTTKSSKGGNIVNILDLGEGEKVTAVISASSFSAEGYLMMVTYKGIVKKTPLSEFKNCRKTGKIAISLDEGDELLSVRRTNGENNIIVATHNGYAICFNESNVRCMGRTARGVRAIKFKSDDDFVVGTAVCEEGKKLLLITENGKGKRTEFSEFSVHGRAGIGVRCYGLNEKSGKLCGITSVSDEEEIMITTASGMVIRTAVDSISVQGRTAAGVTVMRFKREGDFVTNFSHSGAEEINADETIEDEEDSVTDRIGTVDDDEAPETTAELNENNDDIEETEE